MYNLCDLNVLSLVGWGIRLSTWNCNRDLQPLNKLYKMKSPGAMHPESVTKLKLQAKEGKVRFISEVYLCDQDLTDVRNAFFKLFDKTCQFSLESAFLTASLLLQIASQSAKCWQTFLNQQYLQFRLQYSFNLKKKSKKTLNHAHISLINYTVLICNWLNLHAQDVNLDHMSSVQFVATTVVHESAAKSCFHQTHKRVQHCSMEATAY